MTQMEAELPLNADMSAMQPRKIVRWDLWEPIIKCCIIVGAFGLLLFAVEKDFLFDWSFGHALRSKNPFFFYLLVFNGLVFLGALVFRTVVWFRYRPYDSSQVTEWPSVTVLVPAYNEGETVYKTIVSVVQSHYPKGLLKVVAVDDGSRDDTHDHMKRAAEEFPEMVRVIRFDKNQGKRSGIYHSFKQNDSEIIVTVDSDTILEADALRELVTPLVLNPKLGAATGRIRIWNDNANILTRMLKVNFAMAFDFTRAVQSTFSTVFCTSGAFSAYRRSVMAQIIDPWMEQTFLKRKCTYGEDRSLANHILRTGYGTAFQRSAIAFTMAPEKLGMILKMLTRWARSNIRESIIFSRILFHPNRKGNRWMPFLEFFFTTVIVFLHLIMFYAFLFMGVIDTQFLLRTLIYTVAFGFLYMLYYIRIEGGTDFPYVLAFSLFSSVFMVWIFTVAGFTLTTRSWSTR